MFLLLLMLFLLLLQCCCIWEQDRWVGRVGLASQSLWCQIGLTHRLTCDCHPLNIVVAMTVDKCHQQDLFLKPPRSKLTLYPVDIIHPMSACWTDPGSNVVVILRTLLWKWQWTKCHQALFLEHTRSKPTQYPFFLYTLSSHLDAISLAYKSTVTYVRSYIYWVDIRHTIEWT